MKNKSKFDLKINESNCSLRNGIFDFKNIEVKNPQGEFSQENCLTFNRLHMKIDWNSLLKQEVVISEVDVNIEKIICEKSKNNKINITQLKNAFAATDDGIILTKNNENVPEIKDVTQKIDKNTTAIPKKNINTKYRKTTPIPQKEIEKLSDNKTLSFAIGGDKRFVAKDVSIHFGTCELHNVTREGEFRAIDLNKTWNFENVKSLNHPIEKIYSDLKGYGISVVVEDILGSILDMTGVTIAKKSIKKIHREFKNLLKKIVSPLENAPSIKDSINNTMSNLKNGSDLLNPQSMEDIKALIK